MGIEVTVFYKVTVICVRICSFPFVSTLYCVVFTNISKLLNDFTEQVVVAVTYMWECSLRNRLCLSRRRYINIVMDFRLGVKYVSKYILLQFNYYYYYYYY
jgi:hypothetical protein